MRTDFIKDDAWQQVSDEAQWENGDGFRAYLEPAPAGTVRLTSGISRTGLACGGSSPHGCSAFFGLLNYADRARVTEAYRGDPGAGAVRLVMEHLGGVARRRRPTGRGRPRCAGPSPPRGD